MDSGEAEKAQRAAEHKALALHNLGWKAGAGATIWARAIGDELERHEALRDSLGDRFGVEVWERLHGTAFLVVVAIDQVLAFERRVRRLTGDDELKRARNEFKTAGGLSARSIRNLVVHLDAYAVGEGHRQTGKRQPPIPDRSLETSLYWGPGEGTIINLGTEQLNIRRAAQAALALAATVERVRARHFKRVSAEANVALRRRFGVVD